MAVSYLRAGIAHHRSCLSKSADVEVRLVTLRHGTQWRSILHGDDALRLVVRAGDDPGRTITRGAGYISQKSTSLVHVGAHPRFVDEPVLPIHFNGHGVPQTVLVKGWSQAMAEQIIGKVPDRPRP